MDALQMSKGSVMSWEATWQKEKHSKGHFISHKEDVGDIVSISLNFSALLFYVIHLLPRHFEGIRIL
jgi:hypothetical protein